MKLIKKYRNILDTGLGSIEVWDNSQANTSLENRINTITKVASVCFGKDEAKNPKALYNRLIKESMGLPSSSFEFVPVLLPEGIICELDSEYNVNDLYKFGEIVKHKDGYNRVLTNLRALINVVGVENSINYLNTNKEDIETIKNNYFVFKIETDIVTARQWMRHRLGAYNEKSRRYTKDEPTIYTPSSLNKVVVEDLFGNFYDIENYIDLSLKMYNEALKKTSAQDARYLLPLGLMTTIWVGGSKRYWKNFIELRTDKHAQPEIRKYAEIIKKEIGGKL